MLTYKKGVSMKENDNGFIKSVVDYYYTTVDKEHPEGNMSAVASHFGITRPKVNKILITAGVIDSPLHRDIMRLKGEGYDTDDIAAALNVSPSTVKINMPYEKVIYNGEEKSTGARYADAFREREKIFLSKVVRKKTQLEKEIERLYSDEKTAESIEKAKKELASLGLDNPTDDPIHLSPVFTTEESKLFKVLSDVIVLHIELDADLSEVKKEAGIKYGTTISRDIIVPRNITLHSLHYVINQAFGFTNSHLHSFSLSDEDLMWITQNKVSRWKKMLGLIFKNPIRDESEDFWDDDYAGGSPKRWMRSKYTGPGYRKSYESSYRYVQEAVKDLDIKGKTMGRLFFDYDPMVLNENLTVDEILSVDGREDYESIEEYDELMKESIEDTAEEPEDSVLSIPYVYSFARKLLYTYDFGDDWSFTITPHEDVEYLEGRVTSSEMKEAIRSVLILARPRVIAADGLPLIEDVGGVYGFIDFFKGDEMYEDEEESLDWARGNGWSGKMGNLKTLL